MKEAMFYIYDTNGNIVGNVNGYRTHRGALQQASSPRGAAYGAIWAAFNSRADITETLIYSVKLSNK